MTELRSPCYTSFDGHRRIATGPLSVNALAVKKALEGGATGPVLLFDDTTGRTVDVDTRGSAKAVTARYAVAEAPPAAPPAEADNDPDPASDTPRGRGRPKLGVVPREVTLLPRHWDWLATQRGGASVALRKLVEDARRAHADKDRERQAQERAYHFMSAIAGDLPGFEEATRALFAGDQAALGERLAAWPHDVRDHAMRLAFGDDPAAPAD